MRNSFRLGELLPVDENIEQERENLSAPSIKLMQTVAAAIREDLAKVKDVLDIYVRRGGAAPDELGPQIELLRKIGDTLGVLGLGEQRARVQAEITRLEALVASNDRPSESALVDIAAALIQVEDRLDDELIGMILPRARVAGEVAVDVDFQHVQSAVLRECVVNLARVKEYISQNVGGTLDATGFDNWLDLMQGMQAGLLMLGKSRAVQDIERVTGHLKTVMQQGGPGLAPQALDRLADAIVSIEYYMETLQAGRSDPWYMLDNAENALAAVDSQPLRELPITPSAAEKQHTGTVVLDDAQPAAAALPTVAPEVGSPALANAADLELIALFLEEAREEQAKITRHLPAWDQDPANEEALIASRRAFHTLRGSGRVVGAHGAGRVFLVGREPAEPAARQDGDAHAADIADPARSSRGAAAADRSPGWRGSSGCGCAGSVCACPRTGRGQGGRAGGRFWIARHRRLAGHRADACFRARRRPHAARHLCARDRQSCCHGARVARQGAWFQCTAPAARAGLPCLPYALRQFEDGRGLAWNPPGRAAESLVAQVVRQRDRIASQDLDLIDDCMTAMENVSRNLDETTPHFVLHDTLLADITRAEAELDRRISADDTDTTEAHEQITLPEIAPPVAGVNYDPEIASIFSDEATELLEASQSSFQGISLTEPRPEEFAALKRPLHTLKGGARMAGVAAMGDLAHELESLIIGIELGTVPPSREARDALQRSLDALGHMRDQLAGGQLVGAAQALLAQVRSLMGGGSPPEPVAEPAPPPPAPVSNVIELPLAVSPEPPPMGLEVVAAPLLLPQTPMVAPPERPAAFAQLLAAVAVPPGARTRPASRACRDGARGCRTAQPAAEPGRRSQHCALPRRTAAGFGGIQPGRAVAHGDAPEGAAQQAGNRDRGADPAPARDRDRPARRIRSAGTGPLFVDPAVLACAGRNRQRRGQHPGIAGVADRGDAEPAVAAGAHHHRDAETVSCAPAWCRSSGMCSACRASSARRAPTPARKPNWWSRGASGELDRQVLERMLPPFEHLLRNAVVHGIETPERRVAVGKPETGQIHLNLRREGAEVIVEVRDDGAGMNIDAIRNKAVSLGLIRPDQALTDEEAMQLILEPGFSTAENLTQAAGRGVGMDVVATEVKKLGGALHMESTPGQGSRFTIRLPFTLAVSHALIVRVGDEFYALPLPTVEGVVRIPHAEIQQHLQSEAPSYVYGGHKYRFQHLGSFVGMEAGPLPDDEPTLPVVLVRAGELSTGLVADELIGSREIVVKPVGPQIASIRGISGATILGDGRIVVILDIGALVRAGWRGRAQAAVPREKLDRRVVALVVDDSITVRRVTQRLLERNGMRVLTARDGMDAVAVMEEHVPDVVLLDIEMPRMDGYEVAEHMRRDERLRGVPIIMITSRVGEKHRARALELGVGRIPRQAVSGKPVARGHRATGPGRRQPVCRRRVLKEPKCRIARQRFTD